MFSTYVNVILAFKLNTLLLILNLLFLLINNANLED